MIKNVEIKSQQQPHPDFDQCLGTRSSIWPNIWHGCSVAMVLFTMSLTILTAILSIAYNLMTIFLTFEPKNDFS